MIFPLSHFQPQRFQLGQWVAAEHTDTQDGTHYRVEGIIIGSQFNHPIWHPYRGESLSLDASIIPMTWDYYLLVVREYRNGKPCLGQSGYHMTAYLDPDLTAIATPETSITLPSTAIECIFFRDVLDIVTAENASIRIHTQPFHLQIDVPSAKAAAQLWLFHRDIAQAVKTYHLPSQVAITSGAESLYRFNANTPAFKIGDQYIEITMPEPVLSDRAQRHRPLLQAIAANAVTVTLHDANPASGYQYLDLLASIPARLNKPREQVLGRPCTIVDLRIAEPRIHAIERALKHGQCESCRYTYDDEHHWEFDVEVAPIHGSEEVVTIVRDASGVGDWQQGHWLNKLKAHS